MSRAHRSLTKVIIRIRRRKGWKRVTDNDETDQR
jgi:hypothetical protein